ncbi:hypothetical protein BCR39DRAFT_600416 [Naematelia encephala]|uniref:Uncharacterized protein n=1 Tax=Naematelia encephala TaxID=71784 RepID=A0A1Y2AQ28_9TREE|nr:hypothetical protein BCR39DRAFT_600416 [Naematelia encephala]
MSLSASPSIPALLIPPTTSSSLGSLSAPTGGILLNSIKRGSEPPSPLSSTGGLPRRSSEPESPVTPTSPSFPSPPLVSPSASTTQRIRFAPLPDPRRPRSLSTGRNVVWKPTVQADGSISRSIEIRGSPLAGDDEDDADQALADEDAGDDEDGSGGEDGVDGHKRGRSWSKSMMSGSWKGTKKLLGVSSFAKDKEKEEPYGEGAPLKKSVSTGGFIGSSPFRFSNETERKRSMVGERSSFSGTPSSHAPWLSPSGSSPGGGLSSSSHRRNSSLEPAGSSPQPVKMLNGRVYGSRRASEAAAAAAREKERLARMEPAFVEWGHGRSGGGGSSVGSVRSVDRLGGEDDEDGSGMEWVRRRREERQRAEQERERQRQIDGDDGNSNKGFSSSFSSNSSLDDDHRSGSPNDTHAPQKLSPHITISQLPPTPIIQVSEAPPSSPTIEKRTEAISVPTSRSDGGVEGGRGVDVFGDDSDRYDPYRQSRRVDQKREGHEEDEDEDEDDEEEHATGDFDDDDEEELAEEEKNRLRSVCFLHLFPSSLKCQSVLVAESSRSTSSAAGVEKISRHKE